MLNSVQAKQLRQLPVVRDEKDKDPPKTRAKTDRWMKSDGWTPIAHVESYLPPPFWPYFSPQRAGPTGAATSGTICQKKRKSVELSTIPPL